MLLKPQTPRYFSVLATSLGKTWSVGEFDIAIVLEILKEIIAIGSWVIALSISFLRSMTRSINACSMYAGYGLNYAEHRKASGIWGLSIGTYARHNSRQANLKR